MPSPVEIQQRLANIRTVEPVVGALRTISLGSWQAALRRRRGLEHYARELGALLPLVVSRLGRQRGRARARDSAAPLRVSVLVVGTERGLVGSFNEVLVTGVQAHLEQLEAQGAEIKVAVLGSKLGRLLGRTDVELQQMHALPVTALVPFTLAHSFMRQWVMRFEAGELDAVDLIYNAYAGPGDYHPEVERLVPPEAPVVGRSTPLPSYTIIETDPLTLYTRIVEQWAAIRLYQLLLDAAASEHSARYQLMEGASENAERLVQELTQALQQLRRQAITREMQELAVGAGLLE